jgi:CRISPR-associated endonuclease Csn1
MKKILGLDLGTNSIGWALVRTDENGKPNGIEGAGSRIIPMDAAVLSDFDKGNSKSQTAERTKFRGTRRLRERHLLRRERLHRVLHLLGFLPKHYEKCLDFDFRLGQFKNCKEPKLVWKENEDGKFDFIFKPSFREMVDDFRNFQPMLFENEKIVPYDWTIYFLRKKALFNKIEKEELAWLLLNFNQKRGYYQLRGEEEEENTKKLVEFHALKIIDVSADEPQKGKDDIWYSMILENGWIYRRSSKNPLFDWKGITKEFIVTTDLDDDGSVKTDKDGNEKRSFRSPSEDDWTLLKKKTESDIETSHKTVGAYIYDTLLQNPSQKINGKLVRTIERKFYKEELNAILKKQKEFHDELNDNNLLIKCVEELYPNNEAHRNSLLKSDFTKLFLDDIIFYQRPLKSKKSLISNCKFEFRTYTDPVTGLPQKEAIKCISKSHPLYQEFRLWKFVKDLKIYEREKIVDGKLHTDYNVTDDFIKSEDELVSLFEWLNQRKEIKQDLLLSAYFKIKKNKGDEKFPYRWNYVEDKVYPCNETRTEMASRLTKANVPVDFLTDEIELALWHILYSVSDKHELEKALNSFAFKNNLEQVFVDAFKKFQPFKKEYGSYSEKAIKKLLPLMRIGKYWKEDQIHDQTKERISKIISGEFDEKIKIRVREKAINLTKAEHFKALPEWLSSYVVYNRHSEAGDILKWESPHDIEDYLRIQFKQHSLRNPIVEQVITETLRVVKDIWTKYGDIAEIHVELGREMKNDKTERERLTKKVTENQNTNLRIKALLAELINHHDVENVRPYSPSQNEILRIYEDGVLNSGIEIPEDISKIVKISQPSKSELVRYKLWLEQKYRSPYTGEIIPLGKLFTTDFEIEHIIPQSRYFDDSFSNKVICESAINKDKDNALGYEYIKNNSGKKVELSNNKEVTLFTLSAYEEFVKQQFGKNRGKMKKLLMEDIPDTFIERQLNDTRYISKVVKSLLSNVVREKDEEEAISKNVIPCTGGVTNSLKHDWGLNDVWNQIVSPRFERLNTLTTSALFGHWENKEGKNVFQTEMPLELQKGFNKKRIDHRHHAMDAIVIACATRSHVNYLNNASAKAKAKESRYELKNKLCFKTKPDKNGNYKWQFHKPWTSFTEDTHASLESIVVSFKQNSRVINRTVNYYQHYVDGKKVIEKQTKGDNWAIRKPLHKDTVAGQVNIRFTKKVSLSIAIDQWELLVDKNLKTKIKQFINEGFDKKKALKIFAENKNQLNGLDISRPEVYYFSNEKDVLVASRVNLDTSFNSAIIKCITDTGIQKILLNHLCKFNEEKDGKIIEHPELAFSPEGIEEMNKNLVELNNGKSHQPINKVRTFELKGNKFNVGNKGNKIYKFVEAAKGTNLFFAIYSDKNGNRSYETIPLNIVIERLKQGLSEVPEENDMGKTLLFHLSPNDLVMVSVEDASKTEIYKMVSCTGTQCFFIPNNIAYPIVQTTELGANNKSEKTWNGKMIKQLCNKLKVDRLGNITPLTTGLMM